MLDKWIRSVIDTPLNKIGKKASALGIKADTVTLTGFGFGIVSLWSIASGLLFQGVVFFWLNRFMDGLDGSVARASKLTDRGGFLDIVCDFIIYVGFVFAFAIHKPEILLWALFLIFSFIGATTTFLAYAIMAAKHKRLSGVRGKKPSFSVEGFGGETETIIALSAICFFPQHFQWVALIFGSMCWVTTLGRSWRAWRDFKVLA